ILLIQEIRDSSGTSIVDLLDQLNVQENNQYSMTISERLGRTRSKEQYAYLYRHNKVTVDDVYQYPDELDIFERPPYCVKFSTGITDGLHEFFLVGVHTAPDMAETEVDALVEVFEAASLLWGTQTKAVSDHYPVEVNIFATGHRGIVYGTLCRLYSHIKENK
ncbi:hypothetical protein CAPTEDRAFT_131541, partial [Capitella teleta]